MLLWDANPSIIFTFNCTEKNLAQTGCRRGRNRGSEGELKPHPSTLCPRGTSHRRKDAAFSSSAPSPCVHVGQPLPPGTPSSQIESCPASTFCDTFCPGSFSQIRLPYLKTSPLYPDPAFIFFIKKNLTGKKSEIKYVYVHKYIRIHVCTLIVHRTPPGWKLMRRQLSVFHSSLFLQNL